LVYASLLHAVGCRYNVASSRPSLAARSSQPRVPECNRRCHSSRERYNGYRHRLARAAGRGRFGAKGFCDLGRRFA
jgi:hypothetical protein